MYACLSLMKYGEAIDWLYGTQLFGIKLGLENTTRLLESLDVPVNSSRRKIIHVAGTNGKGSVCAFSEKILRDAGFRTGLFTSPHLVRFPERIRINGIEAGEGRIAEVLSLIQEKVEKWELHPTFFEITLALAMKIFTDAGCERIVLETGMGGRLDATNVLDADVSVITSIALDHREWLGDTLEQIAAEKAGIIKAGVSVIVSGLDLRARNVVENQALELGSSLIEARNISDHWEPGLRGMHQRENAALAAEAVRQLSDEIDESLIKKAVAATEWPGRFQIVEDRLILDGAHNESAVKALVETWREAFGEEEKATIIFGLADSKDMRGLLRQLQSIASGFVLVSIKSDRRVSTGDMKAALLYDAGEGIPISEFTTLADALEYSSGLEERTLLTGSLFLVGEALALQKKNGKALKVSSQ